MLGLGPGARFHEGAFERRDPVTRSLPLLDRRGGIRAAAGELDQIRGLEQVAQALARALLDLTRQQYEQLAGGEVCDSSAARRPR